jgi:hypothetical protein
MALTDNLLAFYKLDNLTDSSGNGNTLTNNGDVTFSSGKIGNAAVFDGVAPYLSKPHFDIGNSFAISTWFNSSSLSPSYIGITIQHGNAAFYITPDGGISFGDFSSWNASSGPNIISADNWHHVVLVSDNGSGTLFVDGNIVATDQSNSLEMNSSGGDFKINGDAGDSNYTLKVDAVGIWSRALNSTEVAELYNSGNGLEEFGGAPQTQSFVKLLDTVKFSGKVKFVP